MTTTIASRFSRGRNAPKHFKAPPAATHIGARLGAAFPDVYGSWGMLNAVGGIGNQFATSRCVPFATKKSFGLFQYGQSGTPVEFSADWIYALALSEIRRVELGGGPAAGASAADVQAFAQLLLANPLTDEGSEPSALFDAARRIGIAPESAWPTGVPFSPKEMDLGGALAGDIWLPEAAGFTSLVAVPGPALTQAALAGLMPFADGKMGQCVQVSIGSSTPTFDAADGSRPLLASDFNQSYDHGVVGALGTLTSLVVSQLFGRALTAAEQADSPSGRWFVLANSWDATQWCPATKLPELNAAGQPTGNTIAFPGAAIISEAALWTMTDFSVVAETVPAAA